MRLLFPKPFSPAIFMGVKISLLLNNQVSEELSASWVSILLGRQPFFPMIKFQYQIFKRILKFEPSIEGIYRSWLRNHNHCNHPAAGNITTAIILQLATYSTTNGKIDNMEINCHDDLECHTDNCLSHQINIICICKKAKKKYSGQSKYMKYD